MADLERKLVFVPNIHSLNSLHPVVHEMVSITAQVMPDPDIDLTLLLAEAASAESWRFVGEDLVRLGLDVKALKVFPEACIDFPYERLKPQFPFWRSLQYTQIFYPNADPD